MTRRFLTATLTLLAGVFLGGCASLPDDAPVVENLDPQTGVTVARLGRPLELYRESGRSASGERFAFLGPFETNQMGTRELFLWIALPMENPGGSPTPTVLADGVALELGEAGKSAEFAGLQQSPYKIPMSWIAMYYFRIDADTVAKLAAARELRIRATDQARNGPLDLEYLVAPGADPRLTGFAAR
ncbi:MAG TPA: hypothetical protein VFV88_07025 [Steroidobacteraceae bacterium]|jgi:hypothetical protein|nr:hypothetical protein [Steroidobacteraceae bacterium]